MHDVVIVGAGPGGSATAHYLAQQGLDALLLDKFDFPRDKTCGDAVTPRGLGVLQEMGLLDNLTQEGYRVRGFQIFAPHGHSTLASFPRWSGLPDYALVVPRLVLDNAILERAVQSGAKFQGRVRVTRIEPDGDGVTVRGECQGRSISFRARLAIIATGASFKLLLRLGLLQEPPLMMLAARAYYENVSGLDEHFHFHFDGVLLPGYGWVFPLPDSRANIGAGFLPGSRPGGRGPATGAAALEDFLQSPLLRAMLDQARQVGPVKGYPLRIDFPFAPTFGERVLLVGEAAGLVNPLTGEGIDYALESGRLAARHAAALLATGDLSQARLAEYDRQVRHHFQQLFLFCHRLRKLFLRPRFINLLVSAADHRPHLKLLLTDVVLGNKDVTAGTSRKTVIKATLALAAELGRSAWAH